MTTRPKELQRIRDAIESSSSQKEAAKKLKTTISRVNYYVRNHHMRTKEVAEKSGLREWTDAEVVLAFDRCQGVQKKVAEELACGERRFRNGWDAIPRRGISLLK